MAVQAQPHLLSPHAFPPIHDLHAFKALEGSVFLDDLAGCATAPAQPPLSDLTCVGNNGSAGYGFAPRKRARFATGFLEAGQGLHQQGAVMPLGVPPQGQVLPAAMQSRAVGCGAASTSGRAVADGGCLSQGVLAQFYHQRLEIDALVRLETERMRAAIQESLQRQVRAMIAAVELAAAGRLRAAEAEVERARLRNAELEERLRQLTAEGQAWLGVAKGHEAAAAGLRATLDQLLQPPPGAACGGLPGDAEDAQSCCFEEAAPSFADVAASLASSPLCKACGAGDACVLVLPCRHLCLCGACEAAGVDACPVCAATKNASLHVLR